MARYSRTYVKSCKFLNTEFVTLINPILGLSGIIHQEAFLRIECTPLIKYYIFFSSLEPVESGVVAVWIDGGTWHRDLRYILSCRCMEQKRLHDILVYLWITCTMAQNRMIQIILTWSPGWLSGAACRVAVDLLLSPNGESVKCFWRIRRTNNCQKGRIPQLTDIKIEVSPIWLSMPCSRRPCW